METWKECVDFPDYEISTMGRLRRKDNQCLISASSHRGGFLTVNLRRDGKRLTRAVHILVLRTFVGERPNDCAPYFKNGDKRDCRLENLEWVRRLGKDTIYKLPNLRQGPLTDEDAETGAGSSARVVRRW